MHASKAEERVVHAVEQTSCVMTGKNLSDRVGVLILVMTTEAGSFGGHHPLVTQPFLTHHLATITQVALSMLHALIRVLFGNKG